jgi:transcriptional regulator with XRE-family HTH domain
MESYELLKKYRRLREKTQKEIADKLGMTQSGYAKIERGEREANRELVTKAAEFFNINEEDFLTNFFSDQVAKIIYKENNCNNILRVAEQKIKYIKTQSLVQGDLNFDNE